MKKGNIGASVSQCSHLVEISAGRLLKEKGRVCWGPLQTSKDTIIRLQALIYPRCDHMKHGPRTIGVP
jgi:hypothetical protein